MEFFTMLGILVMLLIITMPILFGIGLLFCLLNELSEFIYNSLRIKHISLQVVIYIVCYTLFFYIFSSGLVYLADLKDYQDRNMREQHSTFEL